MMCGLWISSLIQTGQGRAFKVLNIVDEYTREHIGCVVDRSINAAGVVELLDVTALEVVWADFFEPVDLSVFPVYPGMG